MVHRQARCRPGFVALVTPNGIARTVAQDSGFPNGMAVTADNLTLVVADSYRHQLLGFDIGADGSLSGRRVWADLGDATPDGICLDAEGAARYADVPRQHCVRVAEGGQRLATVPLDRGGFACMLGGTDGLNLYVVAARWPGMAGLGGDAPWKVKCCALRSLSQGRGGPPAERTSAAVRWLARCVAVRLPARGLQALHGSVG